MKKLFYLFILAIMTIGCTTMPTKQEIARLDYGAPLTIDYEPVIKQYIKQNFKKFYTAPEQDPKYEFCAPEKRWVKRPALLEEKFDEKLTAGYLVFAYISLKNKNGVYVVRDRWGFLFRNNELFRIYSPAALDWITYQ
jgi:hypothetical protein